MILGASEGSRIKTATKPQAGKPSEPIAELTHLRWTMRPQGRKSLAPMSFLFPISFFSQVRVQDSATGNIVTQYYLLSHQLYAGEEGGMSPSRMKNKTCQREDELLRANSQHASGIVEH